LAVRGSEESSGSRREIMYIQLRDLEVYKLSRELSVIAWDIYSIMSWQAQKIVGEQFVRSTDSMGANIAEGYGRFHYLDKVKFYYNARGSYIESIHWIELIEERKLADPKLILEYKRIIQALGPKLNKLITATKSNISK